MRRSASCCFVLLLLVAVSASPAAAQAAGADGAIANGWFYSQANGQGGGAGEPGFAITDDNGVPFWSVFSQTGGVPTYGYPISMPFELDGFLDQAMQKSVFQWTGRGMAYLNVLDILHQDGEDGWLQTNYLTPPTAEADGAVVVVRCQRAVLQQWLTAQPWAAAGQVTVANGGDIAKAAGILPAAALIPQAAPTSATTTATAPVPYSVQATTSANWSGYVAATNLAKGAPGSVSDVQGRWTVPAVNCALTPDAASAVWVGLDGVTSNTVEQTGIAANCNAGKASYYAWIEIYPLAPRTSVMTINAGDQISAEVAYLGGVQYQLSLHDLTTGQGFSVRRLSPGKRTSAEWVVEAPGTRSGQVSSLAAFGSVSFTNASATISGVAGPINASGRQSAAITMRAPNGPTKAVPSALGTGGSSFQVTWQHA